MEKLALSTILSILIALSLLTSKLSLAGPLLPPGTPSPSPVLPSRRCPINTVRLNLCANILSERVNVAIPLRQACCPVLQGLVDLDAAVCLCTVLRGRIFNRNIAAPLTVGVLVNDCGREPLRNFQCPI